MVRGHVARSQISDILSCRWHFLTWVLQNIVRDFARDSGMKSKNFKVLPNIFKYRTVFHGNFCSAIGNAGVISMNYRLLVFVSVSSYLRLYLSVLCLFSFHIVTEPPHRWQQKGSMLSFFFQSKSNIII